LLIVCVLVLAAPATAAAHWSYRTQTKHGTDTSVRQLGKGCSARRDSAGTGLLVSCSRASASAVVRYVFDIPSSAGTVLYHPNTQWHYTSGKVSWSGVKLSRTRVRISCRLAGVSRTHIYSVFISYYR
jgi:hypothetical protein